MRRAWPGISSRQRCRDDGPGHRRSLAPAVRAHRALSLLVRAANARAVAADRRDGERLRHDGAANLALHDAVLGHTLRYQFRHGRGHGHHHGVPVRHQLGLLLTLCRRHLRSTARDRRADGVLPRGDLRRDLLLRLGSTLKGRSSRRHLARGDWRQFLGAVDLDRQRLDAESRGRALRAADHADGTRLVLRSPVQHRGSGKIRAYRQRGLRDGIGLRARGQLLLSSARAARRVCKTLVHRGRELRACLSSLGRRAGRRERLHRDAQPENEDRGHRGDMGDRAGAGGLHAFRISRRRGRRHSRQSRSALVAWPDRDPVHRRARPRDPRPRARRQGPHRERHSRLQGGAGAAAESERCRCARRSRGARRRSRLCTPAEALLARSRRRRCRDHRARRERSRARRAGAVLGIPFHGRARILFHRAVRGSVLPRLGATYGEALVPAPGALESTAAVDRGGARLDRGGVRPPAVGGRGRLADLPWRILGLARRRDRLARGLRVVLQRACHRRYRADGARDPARTDRGGTARPASVRPGEAAGRLTCRSITTSCDSFGGRCSACC